MSYLKNKTGDNLALLNQYLQLMSAHMGGTKASYIIAKKNISPALTDRSLVVPLIKGQLLPQPYLSIWQTPVIVNNGLTPFCTENTILKSSQRRCSVTEWDCTIIYQSGIAQKVVGWQYKNWKEIRSWGITKYFFVYSKRPSHLKIFFLVFMNI